MKSDERNRTGDRAISKIKPLQSLALPTELSPVPRRAGIEPAPRINSRTL